MFIVEGNIGVGKSTLLTILRQNIEGLIIEQEPLGQWENVVGGQSILQQFYNDSLRWGYSFELATFMNRVQHYTNIQKRYHNDVVVMERSLYSGYYCFAYNSYQQGFLTPYEWNLYQQWFDFLITKSHCIPRGFIYLRCKPEVAYERIQKRARNAEATIDYEYIKQIHERHEQFLIKKYEAISLLREIPILIIEANDDFVQNRQYQKELTQQVKEFITSI